MPWITYPAIDWLGKRLVKEHRVFEYGSGHSTLWYARHVSEVVAVEHDFEWTQRLIVPRNVTLLYRADGDAYVNAIADFEEQSFHCIGIDGPERTRCAELAPSCLLGVHCA